MRILAVGDLVGENGVEKLKKELPKLRKEKNIDFVIVNAENSAGGMGITNSIYKDLKILNVNAITMGNHTWGKKDIFSFIDDDKINRPANYSRGVVGKGFHIYTCNDKKICVINLIGRTDMGVQSENPFLVAEDIVNEIKDEADIIVVDMHAEATAEKIAMKHFLDGKVTVIFGTHTHVQTADEEITEKGTGYISDIGMTGPIHSVIGMNVDAAVKRFLTSLPERYKLAEGACKLEGCIFEINDDDCRTISIERVKIQ
ncbi:MAG: TIGR00282 family metallophosphoesterase [Clostridia bacterium]|nr:TIGR00282 family metallophosphoesterase [Clostridia bacterium]